MKTKLFKRARFDVLIPLVQLTIVASTFCSGCSKDPSVQNAPHSPIKASPTHEEPASHKEHDHSDPEKQRQMGIYHFNEGNKFLREKNPQEAIRNYQMALKHSPEFLEVSINLTTAYLQDKRLDKAHEILKTLQEKNPKNPLLFYNLACYYAIGKQTDVSLEALQKAVALGYGDFNSIKSDPDLENLRKDPKFTKWINSF